MKRYEYPRLGERCYRERLACGLPVCVVSRPGYTRTMALLAVDYGGMDTCFTLDGKACQMPEGVAHYLEHKMFDMKEGSALTRLSGNGASVNAYTAKDLTAYHFTCTDRFSENLRILLRFVTTPYFTPESVEKERGIIAQEIQMYWDNPAHRVYENLLSGLYVHHPLRRSILGTKASIDTITPAILKDCHRAFYAPEHMSLVVVGDIDPKAVVETANMTLQSMERHQAEKDPGPAEPTAAGRESVRVEMPMPESTFLLGCKAEACPPGEAGLARSLLGDVAAQVLCGESSPLYARLYEQGLIHKDFFAGCLDYPGAAALVLGGDSPDPEAVREAVFQQAERIVREGVEEERFRRAVRSVYGSMVRSLNSFESVCALLVRGQFAGYDIYRFPEQMSALTAEMCRAFLAQTVQPPRSCLSVAAPKGGEGK